MQPKNKGGLPRHPEYHERQTRVAQMRANGVTFETIARDMHLSKSRVMQIYGQYQAGPAPRVGKLETDPAVALYRAEKAMRADANAETLREAAHAFDKLYDHWLRHRSARIQQPRCSVTRRRAS